MHRLLLILASAALLASCRPEPMTIEVPQSTGQLAVSSACINDSTVYVSASYSINSLQKLMDTTATEPIPRSMVLDSGLVIITAPGASSADTLRMIRPGLFGSSHLTLTPGVPYKLHVQDYRKGKSVTAATTFQPRPDIDTLMPECIRKSDDSIVKLRMHLPQASPNSYYVVSYNTVRSVREKTMTSALMTISSIYNFAPKQVELFATGKFDHGAIDKEITLQVEANDTLIVQIGKIDREYFNYLEAYKRTGALINQLTGEPINLPNNIQPGFGYFALYQPMRRVYDLNKY